MNILVTGGAGFIGSHMAKRHLADGHRVVDRRRPLLGPARAPARGRPLRPGRHRRDGPRAPAARGEDRLRLAPRRADRPAPQRRGPDRRRAREHHRQPQALRGHAPRGHAARALLLDRRRASTASPRAAARRTESHPTNPDLSLRLRQALDREVHALLPRRPRLPDPGLPLRQRLRAVAGRHGRGRRRRDLLGGHARGAPAQDQRRRRADAGLRLRGRPRRAAARAATTDKSGVWNLGTGVETSVNRLFSRCWRASTATPRRRLTSPRPRASRCAACSTARWCAATSGCRTGRRSRTA